MGMLKDFQKINFQIVPFVFRFKIEQKRVQNSNVMLGEVKPHSNKMDGVVGNMVTMVFIQLKETIVLEPKTGSSKKI